MDITAFHAELNKLPTRQLIAAMRVLNNSEPLGYDYMKRSKADLQAHALQLAYAYAQDKFPGEGYAATLGAVFSALKSDGRVESADSSAGTVGIRNRPDAATFADAMRESGGGEGHADANGEGGGGEGDEDEIQPDGPGATDGDKSRKSKMKDSDAKGGRDGEGKDGKDGEGESKGGKGKKEARKPPTTPEEMMAEAMRQMLEKDKSESSEIDEKTLEKMIQKAMEKQANVYRVEVKHNDPLTPDFKDEARPRHAVFKEVIEAVNAGRNVLLVGPAGCGKTFMAMEVAKALGLTFRFTGAVASEYKLLGFINAQGALVRTQYREAYEHGALFLWDELDGSAAQAMLSFNAGLANGYQDFPDNVVPRHKDFRALAAANTYGHGADRQYVGRNQLDAASLDRFYTIPMDYDEELERSLYGAGEWVKFVQKARAATRKLNVRHVVSMRAIEDGLVMLKTGTPRADVERGALWKHLGREDVAKVKAQMFSAAA